LRDRAATANGIFIVFVVSIGFALIPGAIVSFIVNEREKNLKHMQLISGMSLIAYWTSNMLFDFIKAIIPSGIVIGLIYAFDLKVFLYSFNLLSLITFGFSFSYTQ
jgi:ATP-binding cassette subfamily A (ABC1) protein 3